MYPELAGRFFTTEPLGKPNHINTKVSSTVLYGDIFEAKWNHRKTNHMKTEKEVVNSQLDL